MLLHVIFDVVTNDDNEITFDEVSVSNKEEEKLGIDCLKDRRELTTAKDLLLTTICTNR